MDAMGKTLFIILLLLPLYSICQDNSTLLVQGNELYKKQEYAQAAELYQKATDIDKQDPTAPYNLGNALRKMNKLEDAEKAYAESAERAKVKLPKSASTYNEGVALTRQNKLMESIGAYKNALRLNPTDQQARENLQLALNQLKKNSGGGGGGDKKNDPNKDKNEQQQKSNSKLSKNQAEQMLNALRQDEKKEQQNIQKNNNSNNGSNKKDW